MSDDPQAEPGYDALEFYTSARVAGRAATDALLEKAREAAPDPTLFEEPGKEPFFWDARISTDEIDHYFTRMHDTTLQNYATDAANGVSFMDSHNIYKMGLGRSLEGVFVKASGSEMARVDAAFYTVRGLTLGGTTTNDFIDAVRGGLQKDVSVGFTPGRFECNLCRGDPFDWWTGTCLHIPGLKYDKEGNTKRDVRKKQEAESKYELCFAWVMDGHLREVSAVYKGATPSAHITKIRLLALKGELDENTILQGERLYRIHVPRRVLFATSTGQMQERIVQAGRILMTDVREPKAPEQEPPESDDEAVTPEPVEEPTPVPPPPLTTPTPAPPPPDDETEEDEEEPRMSGHARNGTVTIDAAARVRAVLERRGIQADTDPFVTLDRVLGEVEVLKPRAEMGDTYFTDMVEQTIQRGISAFGDEFDEEGHRAILGSYPRSNAGLKLIKQMHASFDAIATKRFPGGRQTTEHDNETPAASAGESATNGRAAPSEIAGLGTFRS